MTIPQVVALEPSDRQLEIIDTTGQAALFGLAAIACISLGFSLVPGTSRQIRALAVPYRPKALIGGYFALFAVSQVAGPLVGGGLAQPIVRATEAVRHQMRTQLGLSSSERVILFACKLVSSNRPLDVVTAAERLRARGLAVRLLIAGSRPLEETVVQTARASGVALTNLGFCNQSKTPQVYAASDLLVLPSIAHETWGLVANEALACGIPVVLSDAVGAAPNLAEDGRAGATFQMGNVKALAEAIETVFLTPPKSDAIFNKAGAHSIEAAVDGILAAVQFTATLSRFRQNAI